MSNGRISARSWQTGEPVRIQWENGIITEIAPATESSGDLWIAPALLDPQINGFAGVDFQQENLSLEALECAAGHLAKAGCTRFLATLITDEWPILLRKLRRLRALRDQSSLLKLSIVGWHIEGPFLSSEPGFCGAHNPSLMCDPTAEAIQQLRAQAGGDLVLLTLAPERHGALSSIAAARERGIRISLGHTNAGTETLMQAAKAGATGFTHLGNGCPQLLDRHDNILYRVLECHGLYVSLIPDNIHVSPALFRLAHGLIPRGKILYTSDAMAAAGAPPGRYPLGSLKLEVGGDGIVRLPGKQNFAGSSLRPIDGVLRAAHMLSCSWRDVWEGFSEVPSAFLGLDCGLTIGNRADFCVLQEQQNGQPSLMAVYHGGASVAAVK